MFIDVGRFDKMRRALPPCVTTLVVAVALCLGVLAAPMRIDVVPGESLLAVRDRVRAIPAENRKLGVEVVLASGEYILPKGLTFTESDGGSSDTAPVVWRAAKPGEVRISGAARIPPSAFAKIKDPALIARLPEEGRGKVYAADISEFAPAEIPPFAIEGKGLGFMPKQPAVFIDGKVGVLAQWPNGADAWQVFSKCVDHGAAKGEGKRKRFVGGAFVFSNPRLKRWDFTKGVWLSGYFTHDWATWAVPAVSWGAENGTNDVVRLKPDASVPYGVMGGTWGRKDRRFRAFNLFEELDSPGEWWLDRERKILYVVPLDGTLAGDADIRIAFSGNPLVSGRDVSNIRFEGIEFIANYGRLFDFDGVDGVVAESCRFSCAVDAAVSLNGRNCRLSDCEVCECGSSGVLLYGGDRKTLTPALSSVENCRIHDFGILQRTYAGGVHFKGCGLALRGCEIFNAPHTAVFFGCNDSVFESNDVHHVVMETGDAGAFYTGRDWTTQGNIIRHNYIHDIGGGTAAKEGNDAAVSGTNAMGLYFDDCDCGDEVCGNVFLNVPRGIMIGGGRDHPVRGNVFVNCRMGMSIDCRGIRWKQWNTAGQGWDLEEKANAFDYTKGVWARRYPRLANIMNDYPREPLYNPVEGNTFIDCGEILNVREVIRFDGDGTAPGIFSRMAPIRNNVVVYTKGTKAVSGFKPVESRIASGFRVLGEWP